jgi:hypothetical protein
LKTFNQPWYFRWRYNFKATVPFQKGIINIDLIKCQTLYGKFGVFGPLQFAFPAPSELLQVFVSLMFWGPCQVHVHVVICFVVAVLERGVVYHVVFRFRLDGAAIYICVKLHKMTNSLKNILKIWQNSSSYHFRIMMTNYTKIYPKRQTIFID